MTGFWENVLRYPRFFFSTVLGLIGIILSPIVYLYKESNNKIITIIFVIIFCLGIIFTLNFMIN
jgi:hypothetical protein